MKKQLSGFSIIELLISMVILVIIFSVIGAMLHSSSKTYRTTAAIAEEVEITDAAARLLRYDISLSGYIGLDGVERDLEGDPVLVMPNTNSAYGEVVEVRYFEDRYTVNNQPELRYISYYVGQNQEGQGLLRDDHMQEPQLLMSGVSNLTTEMQPRGVNLNLSHNVNDQVVRIVFNLQCLEEVVNGEVVKIVKAQC